MNADLHQDHSEPFRELSFLDRVPGTPDLLAQHAGLALGRAQDSAGAPAPSYLAEVELCKATGAGEAQMEPWTEIGRKPAGQARLRPYD
jgi:hypothetical protein